jgi:hypothetical protein
MTDTVATEAPTEAVPFPLETALTLEPASPAPEAAAAPPAPDEPVASSAEVSADRVLPEIEHAIGATRQRILDEFLDADRAELSMSEIKALLPDVLPGTVEACVRREWQQGRLERTKPGTYRLAPPKAVESPKPPPLVDADKSEDEWFDALEAWAADPASWPVAALGPPPDDPASQVPLDIRTRFLDRVRKREARRRDAAAALARQAAADQQLRDQLLAVTGGNFVPGPGLDDVAPIKSAMQIVDLDTILIAIRGKLDLCWPPPPPLKEWRETRLLEAIATMYCRQLGRRLVAIWSKAGMATGKPTEAEPTVSESAPALPPPEHVGISGEDLTLNLAKKRC